MQIKQYGFTLIELVIVIVILGILSVIALPKFIDLSGNANTAATRGVASALAAASAVNYSARKVNSSNGVAIATCASVPSALAGGIPSGYTVSPATSIGVDSTVSCTVTGPGSTSATFNATGIS